MSTKKETEISSGKLPYEKPELRSIELYAEEVLAVGCKLSAGATASFGAAPCTLNFCAQSGS